MYLIYYFNQRVVVFLFFFFSFFFFFDLIRRCSLFFSFSCTCIGRIYLYEVCRYYLHVPCLTYLLVRAIRSIDRSNSKYMIGKGEKTRKKRKRKRGRDLQRESRYFFAQGISLHEITYISLEYPDGKDNQARIQTR